MKDPARPPVHFRRTNVVDPFALCVARGRCPRNSPVAENEKEPKLQKICKLGKTGNDAFSFLC